MNVEEAVYTLATKSYGDSYGGMVMISNRTQIAIYLTNPTPEIEQAFNSLAPAGMLVFRKTPHSLRQLGTVHAALRRQWDALAKQGIDLNEFGPDIQLGKEDIGVVNLTPGQVSQLDAMFGADMIHVYNITQQEARDRVVTSRTWDVAPYNAGDAIANVSLTDGCSAGFGVLINGNPRLLTAGHCFSVGWNIINGRLDPNNGTLNGSGRAMGKVTENDLTATCCDTYGGNSYTGYDTEVFTGCNTVGTCGGDDLIWTGTIGNPVETNVAGQKHWGVDDQVCTDGANGGEICGLTVTKYDFCNTFWDEYHINKYHFCSLTKVHGSAAAAQGDSGGPVFKIYNGGIYAIGTISASDTSGDTWFTGIYKILSIWGATLITG